MSTRILWDVLDEDGKEVAYVWAKDSTDATERVRVQWAEYRLAPEFGGTAFAVRPSANDQSLPISDGAVC